VRNQVRTGLIRGALVLAGALPYLAFALGGGPTWLARWFRFQCHGRIDRTLALGGQYFPVCSRCLGIYTGLALASILVIPKVSAPARRMWIVGAALAMVLEVYVQDASGHAPIHVLRLVTGLLLAWPVALTLVAAGSSAKEE